MRATLKDWLSYLCAEEELNVGEFCHAEIFRAACADDEVVLMERALYGRMSLGRCVELDMGHLTWTWSSRAGHGVRRGSSL